MAWKVRTRNENVRPPMETSSIEYASKDEALNAACDDLDHSVHVKVLYIEGPDGSRIELADIKAWCRSRPKAP
jgi:hypothetical protein